METLLMIVTIVALAFAIGMSVVAWRMLRENRLRSAARVEALREFVEADEDPRQPLPKRFASIDDGAGRVDAWDLRFDARDRRYASGVDSSPEVVFSAIAASAGVPKRRWLALAVAGILIAATAGAVYTLYGPVIAAESSQVAAQIRARGTASRPLELLSLRHSNGGDGTFAVTGLIQNPADGLAVRNVVAVVYLFDRDGTYFASGKAPLDFTVLHPGDESPFVVRVPNVSRVSRYRVGFRFEEGGIVAHVDRRGQLPGGTTGDSIDASRAHRPSDERGSGRP